MKKAWQNFIKSFQPTYSVNAITYFVIPGIPVNKNENRHDFDKGAYDEAKAFFEKVAKKTKDLGFSPAEIQLIKGKSKVVEKQVFGPVDLLKDMPMSVN
jgi:hypothetical protein